MIQPAKITHFTEQGFTIRGIVHAGISDGEEIPSYLELGIKPQNILCFEPLKSAYDQFCKNYPKIYCENMGLHDRPVYMDLNVTEGDGEGSSIFKPITDHPEVVRNWRDNSVVIGTQKAIFDRLDLCLSDTSYGYRNYAKFDCLVLDTQGNEWEVLHGCGDLLHNFKYISVELSKTPVYHGEHPGQEVIDWLVNQGYTQDTMLQSHNDVFFIRSDIKPKSDWTYYGLA